MQVRERSSFQCAILISMAFYRGMQDSLAVCLLKCSVLTCLISDAKLTYRGTLGVAATKADILIYSIIIIRQT